MSKHFPFDCQSIEFSCHTDIRFNKFDVLLQSEWDRALAQNLFTFQIDNQIKQRILDGDLRYIIELNPSRFEKRRIPHPFENVNTPFDRTKFNFNKIQNDEILFSLENDQHLVIINNSPIRPYHVLLVPNRQLEQPQILNFDCLLFGLRFLASSAHPFIYVGFNSLCGYASINHLHLHGMYMPNRLFLQTIKCSLFHSKVGCYLFDLFETQAFAFEIEHIDDFSRIIRYILIITNYFVSSNIAHNLSMVKGDSFSRENKLVLRVFIWFRQSNIGAKLFDRCNFACLELSGYMFLRFEDVFNDLTENELKEQVNKISLAFEQQEKIKDDVMKLFDTETLTL